MKFLLVGILFSLTGWGHADPAAQLQDCVEGGGGLDQCLQITMTALKEFMKVGVPELGLPPLDPMKLDNVEFNLATAVVTFQNVTAEGLSDYQSRSVGYDKQSHTMEMVMAIPKLSTMGSYILRGKVLNVEGLDSTGPYRNEYSGVTVDGKAIIEKNGNNIQVGEMSFRLKLNKINVHLECLFPKPDQACCEKDRKYRSCNPIFAKTIHRTINTKTGGSSFVEKFQDEITGRIAEISKDYLNRALSKVESKFFF